MKLGDAELQQATGFVIAHGGISVGLQFDKVDFGVPKHERILIASPSRSNYLRTSMLVWPVIDFARDEHGFCTTALGRIGLEFRLLRLEDIGDLGALDGKVSFVRGGYQGVI
jgi:hypothetical protein